MSHLHPDTRDVHDVAVLAWANKEDDHFVLEHQTEQREWTAVGYLHVAPKRQAFIPDMPRIKTTVRRYSVSAHVREIVSVAVAPKDWGKYGTTLVSKVLQHLADDKVKSANTVFIVNTPFNIKWRSSDEVAQIKSV
jgi:hypothetical protein